MPTKNIPTGYANSKRRVIFTSAGGKPYARTTAGKKVYQPKAKFALNNNGSTRVIKKANLNKIPSSIRPKRAPAKSPAKKPANAFKAVKKASSPSKKSPAKTVRKTVRKVSPTIANVRVNLARRGYTKKAAAKVAPLVKKGMSSNRYSKTTGMVKGRGPRRAYRNPQEEAQQHREAFGVHCKACCPPTREQQSQGRTGFRQDDEPPHSQAPQEQGCRASSCGKPRWHTLQGSRCTYTQAEGQHKEECH